MISRRQIGSITNYSNTGSGTTIPIGSRSILRGSLVVVGFRYESGDTTATVTDSAGGVWTCYKRFNSNVTSGLAYCWNHPGGSSVSITITLGTSQSFRYASVIELSGPDQADPFVSVSYLTGSGALDGRWIDAPAQSDVIAALGHFNNSSTVAAASPNTLLASQTYQFLFRHDSTGREKRVRHTNGSGPGALVYIAFRRPRLLDLAPVLVNVVGSYTLTADNAAWQFAVQDATLRVARKLTAANAPWEFAAQNAGLKVARKITAGNAPWQFAVQDATLTYAPHTGAYTLTAESAAWQFAVPDATLTYRPIGGSSGGWLPSLPTREERDEYIRRQREALGIIPKRIQPVAKVIKRIAKQAAKRGIEPTVEQVREMAPFKQVDTQPIADALAINFRIYLALLERDRQEREKTRQFIAEQIEQAKANAIALEAARLQEEEEVFVVMSLLLAD